MAPTITILPVIRSLQECSSWHLTVAPYWSQLEQLPLRLYATGLNTNGWLDIYLSTNPLVSAFAFSLMLSPIFLVISELNRNYSQVDRVWSILPTVYAAHYAVWAHLSQLPTAKVDNALVASVIWSTRLTFNYWRKGGYSIGSEDYRWEIIQQKTNRILFFLFNVTFISTIQSVLLFAITTPIYVLLLSNRLESYEMSFGDLVFARGIVILVAITAVADQQQWNYYHARETYRETKQVPPGYRREDLELGFNVRGLFSISRHPNFAAEQGIWLTLYMWSCYATGSPYSWTAIGAVSYLILFQGSTWFTEIISMEKYPEYKEYKGRVSMFLPKPTALFTAPISAEVSGRASNVSKSKKRS